MKEREENEIQGALNDGMEDIEFEPIPDEVSSPINAPVKEGDISEGKANLTYHTSNERIEEAVQEELVEEEVTPEQESPKNSQPEFEEPLDAPEQSFSEEDFEEEDQLGAGADLKVPDAHARMAADSFLGIANNVFEVGGGYFVKIRKSKEYIDIEGVVQLIDDQNTRNIKRIKLDEEDKALLRPILMEVLKQRAKKLTPEQQLIAAAISILVKKAQAVAEIRAENKILEQRIREAVVEEMQRSKEQHRDEAEFEQSLDDSNGENQEPGIADAEIVVEKTAA